MKLNDKIFEYRKINNWSQEDLAEKLDVSRQTISKWETGKAIPELDKLIALANLFNISVDELVKEEIDITNEEKNTEKKQNGFWGKVCSYIRDNKKFVKQLFTAIIISILIIIGYKVISNRLNLYKREKDFEKVRNAYNEVVNYEGSYKIWEKYSKKENDKILQTYKLYDIYFEDGKNLVKITEYDDDSSRKIVKQTYIDLSKINENDYNWKTNSYTYNGVVEVYTDDWSHKVLDNYEFNTPISKIRHIMEDNGFNEGYPASIFAENPEYTIVALEMPKHNTKVYSWGFGDSNNLEKKDSLDLTVNLTSNWMAFYSDDYKNDIAETREIISIQLSKIKPNIDDVMIPEL